MQRAVSSSMCDLDVLQRPSPPHFHAVYAGEEALILIGSGEVYEGHLSRRAVRLVQEWEELHRPELHANWELARQQQPLPTIPPLT